MTFIRTPSGIENLFLFHSVDLVVFTEGGENSLSVKEIENGEQNTGGSNDSIFWSQLFELYMPEKKSTLKKLETKMPLFKLF